MDKRDKIEHLGKLVEAGKLSIYEAAQRSSQHKAIDWGSPQYMKQSNDAYGIQTTMQSCLDAGAPPDLLRQIIAMYRRHYAGDEQMQVIINDAEVRYITSLDIKEGVQSGRLSVNEARIRFGLEPLSDPAYDLKIIMQL